jgi:hypothetical protein
MDYNVLQRNAFFSISDNFEPTSNVTDRSEWQTKKHPSDMTSIGART